MSETDSLWLQQSINVPDPLPEEAVTPADTTAEAQKDGGPMQPPSAPTEKRAGATNATGEMDLTRMVLDTSSFLRTASAQRPSVRYQSRASVSNSAFISAHDYDELRASYSTAKRQLLKLSDVQKDLDLARFELRQAQDETTVLRDSNATLKRELEDAAQRADKEMRARLALETRFTAEGSNRHEEVAMLKKQITELREENARRLDDMTGQHESEFQSRMQTMRDELAAATEEVERVATELLQSQKAKEAADARLSAVAAELEKARGEVRDGKTRIEALQQECELLEQQHRDFVTQQEAAHASDLAAQKARNEELVQQISRSKEVAVADYESAIEDLKRKLKASAEELAAARHAMAAQQDELKEMAADRAKELRRISEEHRLAVCELQLQMEAAVREARGSKTSIEEAAHSLRRQLTQVTAELSTVSGLVAQREKQLAQAETELTQFKDRCLTAEEENEQLARDAQFNADAAAEATERVERLLQQKDELEEEYSRDLTEEKSRTRSLETALMQCRAELSALRKDQIRTSDDGLATARDLRAQVETLMAERATLSAEAAERQHAEETAAEYRRRYEAESAKAEKTAVELAAAVSRCASLEARLEEVSRRAVGQALGRPPMHTLHANSVTPSMRAAKARSVSSANTPRSTPDNSLKRARTEDARVFAMSGFDGNELLTAATQLPNVTIAECKSNVPVPDNLTHLISNGNITVKLLTALVKGCWVLPEKYVLDSLAAQQWENEETYGFQHEHPPLLKKRVAMTNAFRAGKHFGTASALLKAGGAVVVSDAGDADIVLCTNGEVHTQEKNWNWERLVESIYPLNIR